eukprot:8881043-Alexandrium_andersonii.AAC.1
MQRPDMQYEETQAGMGTGRILVASWTPLHAGTPGTLPPTMQRAEVRELEPGLADLQLNPRLIAGRRGTWSGVVQPGEYMACAVASGGQIRVTAAAGSTRI